MIGLESFIDDGDGLQVINPADEGGQER